MGPAGAVLGRMEAQVSAPWMYTPPLILIFSHKGSYKYEHSTSHHSWFHHLCSHFKLIKSIFRVTEKIVHLLCLFSLSAQRHIWHKSWAKKSTQTSPFKTWNLEPQVYMCMHKVRIEHFVPTSWVKAQGTWGSNKCFEPASEKSNWPAWSSQKICRAQISPIGYFVFHSSCTMVDFHCHSHYI